MAETSDVGGLPSCPVCEWVRSDCVCAERLAKGIAQALCQKFTGAPEPHGPYLPAAEEVLTYVPDGWAKLEGEWRKLEAGAYRVRG